MATFGTQIGIGPGVHTSSARRITKTRCTNSLEMPFMMLAILSARDAPGPIWPLIGDDAATPFLTKVGNLGGWRRRNALELRAA